MDRFLVWFTFDSCICNSNIDVMPVLSNKDVYMIIGIAYHIDVIAIGFSIII